MGHGAQGRARYAPVEMVAAKRVATTLRAPATPSRLLILGQLRESPTIIGQLANAVAMEQDAVSHQLRLLRNLGLVDGQRTGRSIKHARHDHHVAQVLDEAVYHAEHLRLGAPDRSTHAG